MSKASRHELEQQIAAFFASGGQVTRVAQVDNPKICQARYQNATEKMVFKKLQKKHGRVTQGKMNLMLSSRGGIKLS